MDETAIIGSAAAWDEEYGRKGIPSSYRHEPSGTLLWALASIPLVTDRSVESALDLGCGTGRNAAALARAGHRVSAMDFSGAALRIARSRPGSEAVTFIQGSVTAPLPFRDNVFDFASDTFVYFHQVSASDRAGYRREMRRVLKPGGLLLVSMATDQDGYYSACTAGPLAGVASPVRLTWDPVAGIGNILLSYGELIGEFADEFRLQMSWVRRRQAPMHGRVCTRETAATIWTATDPAG